MLNFLKMATEQDINSPYNFALIVMKALAKLFVCELTNLFRAFIFYIFF